MNSEALDVSRKEEAEFHKTCGNEYMKNKYNEKAIESYSKYIKFS